MIEWAMRREEARQVEYAAEEPRPADMGRLDEAVKVQAGLFIS